MALTFPLPLADFADQIGMKSVKWLLQDNREFSGMGSGQILQSDLAPSLWTGEVTLRPWQANKATWIEAKLDAAKNGTFYLYDPRKAVPALDPRGATLGASTVRIASLPNPSLMSLKGLPAGYRLSAGDYLSFDYGTPARRSFHRIAEDVTASGAGVTPSFTISPFWRTGAAVDNIVTLVKPAMKCILKPGTIDVQGGEVFTQIVFSVVQKI